MVSPSLLYPPRSIEDGGAGGGKAAEMLSPRLVSSGPFPLADNEALRVELSSSLCRLASLLILKTPLHLIVHFLQMIMPY
jgi:hypothetical protein